MMKFYFSFLFSTFLFFGFSQSKKDIQWYEYENSTGRLYYLLPGTGETFYSVRGVSGSRKALSVNLHHKNKIEKYIIIKPTVNGMIATLEAIMDFNHEILVFLSDIKNGHRKCYVQRYTKDLEKIGAPIFISEFYLKGIQDKTISGFEFVRSDDGKKFAVVWSTKAKIKHFDNRYGFTILNEKYEFVNEGDYIIPFDAQYHDVVDFKISNNGDFFMLLKTYRKRTKADHVRFKRLNDKLYIYHIGINDGLQSFTLETNDNHIYDVDLTLNNLKQSVAIAGLYGNKYRDGISGIFKMLVDFNSGKIENKAFISFSDEFITQHWNEKAFNYLKRKSKREKRKIKPTLTKYQLRKTYLLNNKDIIVEAEYYNEITQTYSDPDGRNSRISTHFNYGPIIVSNIDSTGNLKWNQRILKRQSTVDDGGYLSSYLSYIDHNHIRFIFNDNVENYDVSGEFINRYPLQNVSYRKENLVAIASIDLNNGKSSRSFLFQKKNIDGIFTPKKSITDKNQSIIYLYAIGRGRSEKVGILRY